MSEATAPGAPNAPEKDDTYEALLASVRARCKDLTGKNEGKSSLFSTTTPDLYDASTALPTIALVERLYREANWG